MICLAQLPLLIQLPPLIAIRTILEFEFIGVGLEEIIRFLRMCTSDIMESCCRDVVGLTLSNKRIILKEIL